MQWYSGHGGSLAALPEVGLLGGMLAYMQGASDFLPHPSSGCEVESSVFGIVVWALLQATSLPHCMVSSPAPGHGLSAFAFKGCSSALKVFLF